MAAKTVSFNANCNLSDSFVEQAARWLSCNGDVWGVGPTVLFAAAAALFLHHELQASVFIPGDHPHVSVFEKTLVSAMVVGTLALMVHIWVCTMRFFQYYLDTLIKDSPNVLLEMTTAGLLGGSQSELAALGPLTRFLRQQQPQIHITICWLIALCYADYVRKHFCTRFNMPYLEQWQAELHATAGRRARGVLSAVHSFAQSVKTRLRLLGPLPSTNDAHTVTGGKRRQPPSACSSEICVLDASMCASCSDEHHHESLQKLKAYVKATRCACSGGAETSACAAAAPAPPTPDDSRLSALLTAPPIPLKSAPLTTVQGASMNAPANAPHTMSQSRPQTTLQNAPLYTPSNVPSSPLLNPVKSAPLTTLQGAQLNTTSSVPLTTIQSAPHTTLHSTTLSAPNTTLYSSPSSQYSNSQSAPIITPGSAPTESSSLTTKPSVAPTSVTSSRSSALSSLSTPIRASLTAMNARAASFAALFDKKPVQRKRSNSL